MAIEKAKILQVTPRYYPSLGGVEETVKQYSERLSQRFHHDVTVITSDIDSDGSKVVNGIEVKRLKTIPGLKKGPFLPITPTLAWQLLRSNYDLWHLHANKRFTTDLGAILHQIKNTPFVFSPYAGMFGTTILGRLHNRTVGKLAFNADVTIVISQFEKKLIEKANMPVKRFEILTLGVDVQEFRSADLGVINRFNLKNKQVVLFVGRLTRHKGVDTLLQAAKDVLSGNPNTVFLIVGPDFGEGEAFKELATQLGIAEKIIFTGAVSRAELLGCYQAADVFCLPSRSEAFGIVMIEAMAAGTPVIAANNTAMPEIISDGTCGLLFDTENSADLAEKIKIVLNDKKLRTSLINNGALEIAQKYNWDQVVSRLNKLYMEIIN